MSAFQDCLKIEAAGIKMIFPLLQHWAEGGQLLNRTHSAPWLQRKEGDFIIIKNGRRVAIEFKTELENKHGNFFFETASNIGRRDGWVWTCEADGVLYLFQKSRELYAIRWPECQEWLTEHLINYERKEQLKYNQLNKTIGRPVPITHMVELGLAELVNLREQ